MEIVSVQIRFLAGLLWLQLDLIICKEPVFNFIIANKMADVYELEAKSGRIWLNAAKQQVDQSTRIIAKEPISEGTTFVGEQCIFNWG